MSKRSAETEETPCKRARTAPLPPGMLWKMTFPNPHMFQLMLRIISGILTESSFFLSHTEDFQGLHTSSVDASVTCLLSSAFEQRITAAEGVDVNAEKFRLKIAPFRGFLEKFGSADVVEMYRLADGPEIILSNSSGHKSCTYRMSPIQDDTERIAINDIDSAIGVDIPVALLKENFKTCHKMKGTWIRFKVSRLRREDADGGDAVSEFMCFTMESEFDSDYSREDFYCAVVTEGLGECSTATAESGVRESCCLRVVSTPEEEAEEIPPTAPAELLYDHRFSCVSLFSVIRNMERGNVHLSMAPDNPMIITYSLGSDGSYLRGVFSPLASVET